MARRKGGEQSDATEGLSHALEKLLGASDELRADDLDGRVLYLAVLELAAAGATLTIGFTQKRDSWSFQVWDGKYPVKKYFRETAELNRTLAAIVRSRRGSDVSPEVEQVLQEYGW